jgi:hypothetical protein
MAQDYLENYFLNPASPVYSLLVIAGLACFTAYCYQREGLANVTSAVFHDISL